MHKTINLLILSAIITTGVGVSTVKVYAKDFDKTKNIANDKMIENRVEDTKVIDNNVKTKEDITNEQYIKSENNKVENKHNKTIYESNNMKLVNDASQRSDEENKKEKIIENNNNEKKNNSNPTNELKNHHNTDEKTDEKKLEKGKIQNNVNEKVKDSKSNAHEQSNNKEDEMLEKNEKKSQQKFNSINNKVKKQTFKSNKNDNIISVDYLYKGADSSEVVHIADKNLEKALNIEFKKQELSEITRKELESLKAIDLSNKNIKNIQGLEYCKNLNRLELNNNEISDLSPLANLTQLTYLELQYNKIKSSQLYNLGKLVQLSNLEIGYNEITDVKLLPKLTKLTTLQVCGNNIKDISELRDFKNLESFRARDNEIVNIDVVKNFTKLSNLDVSLNKIKDITPIKNLKNLWSLQLGDNPISNIGVLNNFSHLNYLSLDRTRIDNSQLKNLSKLKNLAFLDLTYNNISNLEQLKSLKNLNLLDIGNNNISNIKPLAELTKLHKLNLENNHISDISPLGDLKNLIKSNISGQIIILSEKTIKTKEPTGNLTIENPLININNKNINSINNISDDGKFIESKEEINWTGIESSKKESFDFNKNFLKDNKGIFNGTVYQPVNLIIEESNLNTVPIINAKDITIKEGERFNPLKGVTAEDREDGDLTKKIKVGQDTVNIKVPGIYKVTYEVTDKQGAKGMKTITVTVVGNNKPIIKGANNVSITQGEEFNPLKGITAKDKEDGNLTKDINVTGKVDINKPGKYELTYTVKDKDGNTCTVNRMITVNPKKKEINNIVSKEKNNVNVKINHNKEPKKNIDNSLIINVNGKKSSIEKITPMVAEITSMETSNEENNKKVNENVITEPSNVANTNSKLPKTGGIPITKYLGMALIALGGLFKRK